MNDKSAYAKKFEAQLDEWDAEIDKIEARARQAGADAQIEYQRQLDELRRKRGRARQKLDELESAGQEAWEEIRQGLEAARTELSDALKSARASLSR